MTTPGAAKATTPGTGQWWVTEHAGPHGVDSFSVVQSTAQPTGVAVVAGPFPTQAQAQTAMLALEQGSGNPSGGPSIPNPFSFLAALGWIQEIGHWVGIVVAAATDLHTYISIGWLLLGFWMLVIGILLWLRIPQRVAKAAGDAGAAAAKVAVA